MTDFVLPPEATGVITVDLVAIANNWRALSELVAPAECAGVVKADAYGLGAVAIIPALAQAGCRTFFVATTAEATTARTLAPEARVLVLDGLLPGAADTLLDARAIPVLASVGEVREWADVAKARGERLAAALQVDTGLHRLGLSDADIVSLKVDAVLDAIDVVLVMSHLASADVPDDPKNAAQRDAFEQKRAQFPGTPASLAASDGLMLGAPFHYDLVRPGYALYGGQASQAGPAPVTPVVRVEARVLQVRDVPEGETVGYSATWRAARPSRVAIVAGGYADGLARGLSSATGTPGAVVIVAGQRVPLIGRVSMDLITLDVTDVSGEISRGDLVSLIGPGLTIEAMGRAAGTIGYEVLTRLGTRFARRYVGGGA
jgi:alanine racemase